VSLLIEFLEAITNVMIGVEEGSRAGRIARASDIDPFIRRLEGMDATPGIERCGEDSLRHGEAVLVYAVEPLITPEGRGLADVAVHQLEASGASVERVEQPHTGVLSAAASLDEGWLEARILASRGWLFLISAPTEWTRERCRSRSTCRSRTSNAIQGAEATVRSAKSPTIVAASRSRRQR
jgi:hypothetical protein